ncbi:MAG: tetraacyldisaccharide 4'-kinase [Rhodocyclales bacterium]|nr:tetraacyldisaccharide 4'-kinase [Rhodocyclales bacterium]
MAKLAESLPRLWYRRGFAFQLLPLLPLSWLFGVLSGLRRFAYRHGWLAAERLPVPVLVVGNLVAGGAGKTPLTLWLLEALRARGRRPGIVSRGYGAAADTPRLVAPDDSPALVGDEPLLLARRSGAPVAVCRNRVAAARALLAAHPECDLIVADDGLQHYRLVRDVELVLFDGRGAGNGRLLPAGPLREPLARLRHADAVVWNGSPSLALPAGAPPAFAMRLEGVAFHALADPARRCAAADLADRKLHALAGIGDPSRFFRQLEALGLSFVAHPFPDHHAYAAADLDFGADAVLLMTEKDAVKCAGLIAGEAWVLPVSAVVDDGLIETILEKLDGRTAP